MTIGLFGEEAPKTVENFRKICSEGINGKTYVGTKFHRVINRFVIQGKLLGICCGMGSILFDFPKAVILCTTMVVE